MSTGRTDRIELSVDVGAAAAFAAAAAYALFLLAPPPAATAGGAIAFLVACGGLRSVRPHDPGFALADFAARPIEVEELEELVLTEADRFFGELVLTDVDRIPVEDELLLEDVLSEAADSRVVRLFDVSAMLSPGELHARIDRHLAGSVPPTASTDASQALQQALADLRRSLR